MNQYEKKRDDDFTPLTKKEKADLFNKNISVQRIEYNAIQRFFSKRSAVLGLIVIVCMIVLAIVVPIISPYQFDAQNSLERNLGISWHHWFGTDKFGRDLFVRVWMGARISLMIGFCSALINLCIGVVYGGIAGYWGGIIDAILMRIADILYSIPSMIYVILFVLVFEATIGSMILGICVSSWVGLARMMRNETMHIKENEYVLASKMLGNNGIYIFFQDIVRNAIGPLSSQITILIAQAIFMETFLSFLGIGLSAPLASWGTMIQQARTQLILYPLQLIFPLLILCIMLLALNSIGDGLQYANLSKQTWEEDYESI